MDQLPYGANIVINSVTSTLKNTIINNDIAFITSGTEATSMTFTYEEKNGNLVDINTNLNYTLDSKNKKFTLSNENIFDDPTIKPYIELLCNNVKIPISFIETGGLTNKWYSSTIGTNDITVRGYEDSEQTPVWAKISRYAIVSWNKDETQTIIEKNTSGLKNGMEFYGCYATYGYLNNNKISTTTTTVFAVNETPKGITIPRLDGIQSTLKYDTESKATREFYKYFSIGCLVKITGSGYEINQPATRYYVAKGSKTYNNTDFSGATTAKRYLQVSNGLPKLTTTQLEYKWNSSFFYITENNEYISPATSQIQHEFKVNAQCTYHMYYDSCYSNSQKDCECNFACDPYTESENKEPCGSFSIYDCAGYWGCYNYNGLYCKYYNSPETGGADEYWGCYNYCTTNYTTGRCEEYYTCLEYYSNTYTVSCDRCYGYYPVRTAGGSCSGGYCNCNDNDWYVCTDNYEPCPSDGGTGCPFYSPTSNPWETEKEYCGGTGHSFSAIWIYNKPNGSHKASIAGNKTFSVYNYWNGWFEVANGWIRADADWDYNYPLGG